MSAPVDLVIGVAVLDQRGPYHWLRYLKVGRNFEGTSWDDLPTLPEGAQQPGDKLPRHFPENCPWRYRIDGDTLHVAPSVNVGNDRWHNGTPWSVKFQFARDGDRHVQLVQLIEANDPQHTGRLREAVDAMVHRSSSADEEAD